MVTGTTVVVQLTSEMHYVSSDREDSLGMYDVNDHTYLYQGRSLASNDQACFQFKIQIDSDVERLTVIVKIKELVPPQPKEFNEARGIATADYQAYLEKEWIKQLKETYPVVINEEVLGELVASQ